MYPLNRNRRLRSKQSLRNLIKESSIHPHDFIVPLFIIEGNNLKEEIPSMPNYFRFSLDTVKKEVKQLWSIGVQAVLLFVKVEDSLKDKKPDDGLDWFLERIERSEKMIMTLMVQLEDSATDSILDLGLSKFEHREKFRNFALQKGFECRLHFLNISRDTRLKRINKRKEK